MHKMGNLTVGIPAYNEEANIGFLLRDLKLQKLKRLSLAKVLVVCDGCTDRTEKIVRGFGDLPIKIISLRERQGIANGLNEIMKAAKSEVLVVLNADIRIKDKSFLEKIAEPILLGEADLTSVPHLEVPPKNFLGKSLLVGNAIKRNSFFKWKFGNNIYTCNGHARALSRNFYSQINIRSDVGEDAYSYLLCVKRGFRYGYISNTSVFYKLPENLKDYVLQTKRFFGSRRDLALHFNETFLRREYASPELLMIRQTLKYFLIAPFEVSFYYALVYGVKALMIFGSDVKDLWEVSKSTKYLEV